MIFSKSHLILAFCAASLSACSSIYTPQSIPSSWQSDGTDVEPSTSSLNVKVKALTTTSAHEANQAPFIRYVVAPAKTQKGTKLLSAQNPFHETYPAQTNPLPYRLGIGDQLSFGQIQPTARPDGSVGDQYITRPLLIGTNGIVHLLEAGQIKLAGLTLPEAQKKISNTLLNTGRDTRFDLTLSAAKAHAITIFGSPAQSLSRIPLTERSLNLSEALILSGLSLTPQNDLIIELFRGERRYKMSAQKLMKTSLGQNIYLQAKDRIVISPLNYRATTVIVAGEVGSPRRIVISDFERQTLSDALYSTGGPVRVTADTSQIYLLRPDASAPQNVTAYHLDASDPANLTLASQLELRPNDVIYVAAQPITNFTRFTSQLISGYGNAKIITKEIEN